MSDISTATVVSPATLTPETFTEADAAVEKLIQLYDTSIRFLVESFSESLLGEPPTQRYRAYYPEVRLTTTSYAQIDSRLAFGHVAVPGTYSATITRPDLFANYLKQQIGLLIRNHEVPVEVGFSDTPIPVHFAGGRYRVLFWLSGASPSWPWSRCAGIPIFWWGGSGISGRWFR